MSSKTGGLNAITFYVNVKGNRKRYIIENGLICQLPPEKRIFLVQKISDQWKPSSESWEALTGICFEASSLESFLREGYLAIKGKEKEIERGFTLKFLRSEMNRLIFGGLAGYGFNYDVSGKRGFLLEALYEELLPEGSKIQVGELIKLPVKLENDSIAFMDKSLSHFQNMMNLLLKRGEIKIPEGLNRDF
ncbi:MAG: hypothetical protein QXP23_02720 [Fervidicoccaceae archaeon]